MKAMFADGEVLGARRVSLSRRYLQAMQIAATCWTLLASGIMVFGMNVPKDSPLHLKLEIVMFSSLVLALGIYSLLIPFYFIQRDHERTHPE